MSVNPTTCPSSAMSNSRVAIPRRGTPVVCLAAALVVASTPGCASLYLHNAAIEKMTASAKADFDKLKLDAVFDNEAGYLNTLEKEEIPAVRDQGAAQRDAEILLFLRGNESNDGRTLLAIRIDGYLRTIAGKSDRTSAVKLWRIVDHAWDGQDPASTLDQDLKTFLPKVADPGGDALPSPAGMTLAGALEAIKTHNCPVQSQEAVGRQAQKDFDAAMALMTKALSPGQTAQDALKEILAHANKYLADANPYVKKYVSQSLATQIQSLIEATGPSTVSAGSQLTQEARAGLGFLQAVLGIGDAFSHPPRVPHPNALAATQAWLQYVRDGVNLDIAEAHTRCDVDEAQLSAVAAQVYFLSKAGEAFQHIPTTPLDAGQGLTNLLGPAKDPDYAVASSLVYYAEGWNRGFTRAKEILREGYLLQRRAKLERSRRAGTAWVGTIRPGVETLASYGSGGIDPQAITNLLGAIGLGAIAGGVNR